MTISSGITNSDAGSLTFYKATTLAGAQTWTNNGGTLGTRGTGQETQATFNGYSSSRTGWLSYDEEISPAPEPAAHGAILVGVSLLGVVVQRRKHSAAQRWFGRLPAARRPSIAARSPGILSQPGYLRLRVQGPSNRAHNAPKCRKIHVCNNMVNSYLGTTYGSWFC